MKCNNCLKMIHPEEGQVALFCPYCGAPLTGSNSSESGGSSEPKEKTGTTHTESYSYGQGTASKTEHRRTYSSDSSSGRTTQSESVQKNTVKWGQTGESISKSISQPVNQKKEKKKKKGVKKYIAAIIFYILLFFYCLDEHVGGRATALAVIMILLAVAGLLIRKEVIAKKWPSLAKTLLLTSVLMIFPFAYVSEADSYNKWSTIESHESIKWPKQGLADMLPAPISDYGRIYNNNELEFDAEFYNISEYRYRAYVESLKRLGFTEIDYEFSTSFQAANADNYNVYVWLNNYNEMTVNLKSPKQLSYIDWPENEMAELLPVPENLYGRVDVDRSGYCQICVGRIYEEDFKDYIRDCRSFGFTKDYERTKHSYMAYDEYDNLLFIQWDERAELMDIQIWNEDETNDSDGEDLTDELEQVVADDEIAIAAADALENADTLDGMIAYTADLDGSDIYYLIDTEMGTVLRYDSESFELLTGFYEDGDLESGVEVEYITEDDEYLYETLESEGSGNRTLIATDPYGEILTLKKTRVDKVKEYFTYG